MPNCTLQDRVAARHPEEMAMGTDHSHEGEEAAEEFEEITIDITEDGMVWLHGSEWGIELSPQEARELADALRDAAADAEEPVE
jgi:hypothetical protein